MSEITVDDFVARLLDGFRQSAGGTLTEDQAYSFEAGARSVLFTLEITSENIDPAGHLTTER